VQSIGAGMIAEREHLLPMAEEGFDLASLHFPEVNASGCAKALTNFYSAPLPVGTAVQVKVYSAYVEIWHQGKCVARHERCYERHQKVLDLEHYLDTLTKKPGALAGSTALEQCRAQGLWPVSYDRFWDVLKEREGKQAGTKAMIELLLLGPRVWCGPAAPGSGTSTGTGLFERRIGALSPEWHGPGAAAGRRSGGYRSTEPV
jgi:hypothetical protein